MEKAYVFFAAAFFFSSTSYGVSDYSIIMERNIFSAPVPVAPAEPSVRTPMIKAPSLPELDSLIELKGTAYFKDGGSYALINIRRRNEEFIFREGDFLEDAELVEVGEEKAVFIYGGKRVEIALPRDESGSFVPVSQGVSARVETPAVTGYSGGREVPSPDFRKPVILNFESALAELRKDADLMKNLNVAPNIQEGKVEGFRVGNISPESLFYQYGLRDGDVVRRINGILIDSMAKGFAVYNQITRDRSDIVTVEVLRNSAPVVFTFQLQ